MEEREKLSKKDFKRLHDAVDRARNACIVLNDGCCAIDATSADVLAFISMLAEQVKRSIPEEALIRAVELGYKSNKERAQMLVDMFKEKFSGE